MQPDEYLRDPVFQLNLLIWMAKEQPEDYWRIRPVFYELGFGFIYIEQPFPLPEILQKVLKQTTDILISTQPEPDMILGRSTDQKALYFEAKANSFSADSPNSPTKQAYGHLLAVGPVFPEVLKPLGSALLCYVLPQNKLRGMGTCLTKLTGRLNAKNFKPGPYSLHGLSIKQSKTNKSLMYSLDVASKKYIGTSKSKFTIMNHLSEDTDPSPLLLVFTDEDCPDRTKIGFYRRVVIDQYHAALLCRFHSNMVTLSCQVGVDELLEITTQGIWEYLGWKRQKSLRNLVRQNIFKPIVEKWKDKLPGGVIFSYDTLEITWNSFKEKEEFLDWLEDWRGKFPDEKPKEEELPLFDSLEETDTHLTSTEDAADGQEKQS
jgi:hypothetical protein